jgi:hypothetical protein
MGDVRDAVASDDLRVSMIALRDRLAAAIDECEPRELAGLAKQLGEVLRGLASMPGEEKSDLDDLTAARAKRRAKVQDKATGS